MKIAFLAPYSKERCYREWGAYDFSIPGKDVWFFRHFPDRSIEVDIVGCAASLTYKKRIPLVIAQILAFAPSMNKYDVVISSGFLNGALLSALRKAVPPLRRPTHVILDTQAVTPLGDSGNLKLRLARFLLSPVNGVVCLSRSEKSFWEKDLGFSGRAAFAPFAIDTDRRCTNPTAGDYVFSCGATRRDWSTLISASKNTRAKVIIVAGTDSGTGKTGLDGIDIPPNVELLRGASYVRYRELLEGSRFVVVPLKTVAFTAGLTVITQAMAAGKAVIATRNPALLDYISDGETGLFTPAGDAESLADKMTFLLDNPGEAERLGLNARQAMNTHLGEKAMGEAIWSLLQKLQAESSGGSR